MRKILVLGDSEVGPGIAQWMTETSPRGVSVAFASCKDEPRGGPEWAFRYEGRVSRGESESLTKAYASPMNFLVTCYWPWIIPANALRGFADRTLNFHPALLPADRGWYPHVHAIREGRNGGVTLHQLAEDVDAGDVWAQRKVDLPFPITASEARTYLQVEAVELFKQIWWPVFNGESRATPQVGQSNYWTKSSANHFNSLDRTDTGSVESLLRAIACRNSNKRSYIKVDGDQGSRFVHIFFSDNGDLE